MALDNRWTVFSNRTDQSIELIIEPDAISWKMPKGDNFYVWMQQALNHCCSVVIHPTVIQIYADEAVIYHEKVKIWDWLEDDTIPIPPFE